MYDENTKEYYVIQNPNTGKFFTPDKTSGVRACFVDDFNHCLKFVSRQFAEKILKGDMHKKELDGCVVRRVTMILD